MPIYTYECPTDGVTDILSRTYDTSDTYWCPVCGEPMARCLTLPGRVEIKRDWNEKANEYQRDPYTQAKAQLHNVDREEQLRQDKPAMKITEEMIQVGAKAIHKSNTDPPVDPVEKTHQVHRKLVQEKRKKAE